MSGSPRRGIEILPVVTDPLTRTKSGFLRGRGASREERSSRARSRPRGPGPHRYAGQVHERGPFEDE